MTQNRTKTKHGKGFYILIGIPAILLLLCIAGGIWNTVATNREKSMYPLEGRLVNVFDTKMNVFAAGTRTLGAPAIVLIAGLSTPSPVSDYYPVWSRLVSENYVVVLERSGYGWSQPTKRERTVQNITEEDRMALQQAGIAPPYILVAHSMGGLEANMFASRYPDEVEGVVLLDCTSPEIMLASNYSVPILNRMIPAMRAVGLLRLINAISPDVLTNMSAGSRNGFAMMDEHNKTLDTVFVLQNYQNRMTLKEQEMRWANAKAVSEVSFPSDIPVSLIVAVQPGDENHPQYREYMNAQEAWVNQSEDRHVYTVIGRHYIHHYAPDVVCDVITNIARI